MFPLIPFSLLFLACASYAVKWRYRTYLYALFTGFPLPKNRVVVDSNVMVPMADGIKLAADVYRPTQPGKYPVILVRTLYNKTGTLHPYRQLAELFASHGYVFVIQDVRGKYASKGAFTPYAHEALDGHITVTWAGQASWSNGRIALLGNSYLASCAWLATRYKSPYVKAIISMFTSHDTQTIWIDEGIPFLRGPFFWLTEYNSGKKMFKFIHRKFLHFLWKLPVNRLDIISKGVKIPFYHNFLAHIDKDQFWKNISVDEDTIDVDIPALMISGWYDPFLKGTMADFEDLARMPAEANIRHSRLVIGPWGHNPAQKFKKLHFEKHARVNSILIETLKWCDRWLKDEKPAEAYESPVRYFIMGKNIWKTAEQWPLPNLTYQKLYLTHHGANVARQNGVLSTTPSAQVNQNNFTYNPKDPILFRGSYLLHNDWVMPTEQDEILTRNDILIYTTPPFKEELVVAGAIKFILFVSSSALDTDFFAKICDVHPNGKVYNVGLGLKRMRFRDSLAEPKLMEPGKIYRVEISIRPFANAFLKNHCLQLHIASADFPVHERNLNTGLVCETSVKIKQAEQTVHTGGAYDSHLLLPVLSLTEE